MKITTVTKFNRNQGWSVKENSIVNIFLGQLGVLLEIARLVENLILYKIAFYRTVLAQLEIYVS